MKTEDRENGDRIAQAIARAGARIEPPADVMATIRAAVESEWQAASEARRRRPLRRWLMAAAASIAAIAVGALLWNRNDSDGTGPVGTFLASLGHVEISNPESGAPIIAGDNVLAGARVRTAADGRALFSISGASVRLAGNSDVSFGADGELKLEAGRIYIDSGHLAGESPLARADTIDVETRFGAVRHVGTQFEVALEPAAMLVRVRDGRVDVVADRSTLSLGATDEISVDASGSIRRSTITPFSRDWDWTSDLSPVFPIEGRSFREFLDWYAHESGRRLEFASPETESSAAAARLSGSIAGMRPDEALEALAATTRFACDLSDPARVLVHLPQGGNVKLGSDGATPADNSKASKN